MNALLNVPLVVEKGKKRSTAAEKCMSAVDVELVMDLHAKK